MNRRVLLIEPDYKNKYPPMGLMKIATYYRRCKDDVRFFKGDLKQLAADLLCDEFIKETDDISLKKHYRNLSNYIRYGKYSYLDEISGFRFSDYELVIKNYRNKYKNSDWALFDVVGITTLFTFYWEQTISTINLAKHFCKPGGKIVVGGIASTILPNQIYEETGIQPHVGLLDKPGILDEDNTDIIDELPLDYSILEEIDYQYPANDAYFGYMTRGCPRSCAFCAVKTLEPVYKNYIGIKKQIEYIDRNFGQRRDLLLMDNNVFASDCFDRIIDEIKECGFGKGAMYTPPDEYDIAINNLKEGFNPRAYTRKIIKIYDYIGGKLPDKEAGVFYQQRESANLLFSETATTASIIKFDEDFRPLYNRHFKPRLRARYIDFNQGLDARLATDAKMQRLSEINIRPLRIAFDHYEQKDVYIRAIKLAAKHGIKVLSNYLLYNFEDKPEELFYRMKINVELCEELNVTIYSFPMKYHPISDPNYFRNRDYIGAHWNRKFIRAVQAVLNSTKGKIGRGKAFFQEAFGKNVDDFYNILWMPEPFIIYRMKYKENLAKEWREKFISLNPEHLQIAKNIIAANDFSDSVIKSCSVPQVVDVLNYYRIRRD